MAKLILANLNYARNQFQTNSKVFCIVGTMCRCCFFFIISSVLPLCFALSTSYLYVQSHEIACAFLQWTSHFFALKNDKKMCQFQHFTNYIQVLVQLSFNLLRFWLEYGFNFDLLVIICRTFWQFNGWSYAKKSSSQRFEWI